MATTKNAPTETKVKAAAGGAGAGVVVAEATNWVLDNYVHTPGVTGDLPTPVSAVVVVGVTAGLAWLAGWLAKHTPRSAPRG